MTWLVRDGEVLASCEVADTHRSRSKGLLGRDSIEGVILLTKAKSIHTFGMRFAIDVAHVDREMRVCRVATVVPNRLGMPVWRAHGVIEAMAGTFAHWNLRAGDQLEIRSGSGSGSGS